MPFDMERQHFMISKALARIGARPAIVDSPHVRALVLAARLAMTRSSLMLRPDEVAMLCDCLESDVFLPPQTGRAAHPYVEPGPADAKGGAGRTSQPFRQKKSKAIPHFSAAAGHRQPRLFWSDKEWQK